MLKCFNFEPSLGEQSIFQMGFKIGHFEVCRCPYLLLLQSS